MNNNITSGFAQRLHKIKMIAARKEFASYSVEEIQTMADRLRKELDEASRLVREKQ